jgi:hypothetical protein
MGPASFHVMSFSVVLQLVLDASMMRTSPLLLSKHALITPLLAGIEAWAAVMLPRTASVRPLPMMSFVLVRIEPDLGWTRLDIDPAFPLKRKRGFRL